MHKGGFMFKFVSLCYFILVSMHSFAEERESIGTGSLIVTYQTGPKSERLDRIRFFLKNEECQAVMYPKCKAYVDDITGMNRLVVIENLTPGKYIIEFIVPNADNLFDHPPPPREVTIVANKIIKIDQAIIPRVQ
jgi:hypothetical protein